MTISIIILLILLGLVFVVLELLVVQGTILVGVGGLLLIVFGLYSGYKTYGSTTGNYLLLGTITTTALLLWYSFRSKTWHKLTLHTAVEGKMNTFDPEIVKPGDTGKTISRLAPMGKAMIHEQYYEVQSEQGFIDQDKEITVLKVKDNKIIVTLKKQ